MIGAASQPGWRGRECVVLAAVAIAVVLCLPLIGVVAYALRSLILVGVAGVLVAIVSMCVRDLHARARSPEGAGDGYRGLRLAEDVALDAGHCWAWLGDDAVIGADDLVQSALGTVERIELPSPGDRVERGRTLFRIGHDDRTLELPSPVSGTVVAVNDALRDHPELINSSPFGQGWAVRIRSDRLDEERRQLLIGRRAARWFRREVDFLFRLMPVNGAGRGGEAVSPAEIHNRLDDAAWGVLRRSLGAGLPARPGHPGR